MDNFTSKLDRQKSSPQLSLSYNLDYDESSVWELPEITDFHKDLPFYVQEIGMTIAYEHYYVKRKGLDSYMLCYITDGTAVLRYDTTESFLSPDSVFLINCQNEHIISIKQGTHRMKCYFVHFTGAGAQQYVDVFARILPASRLTLSRSNLILPGILKLLSIIQRHITSSVSILECSNLLSGLCYSMVEQAEKHAGFEIPPQILKIQHYLSQEYARKIDLELLSEQFFISKSYLLRQFQKYIGCTPLEYLIQTRMAEAKKLLRSTTLSVSEIGEAVGFSDPSYFVRVFRNREAITPLKYRKIWVISPP